MTAHTGPLPTSTGRQFEITASGYAATITELGAGLRELRYGTLPLITDYPADKHPAGAQGQLLIPWPNRVDHGEYVFDGTTYRLDITEPQRDAAIHGLTRWQPWTMVDHAEDRVLLQYDLADQPGYPFQLRLEAEYSLAPSGLTVTVTASNTGQSRAPYANGAHPYLRLDASLIDDIWLLVGADEWLPTDERKIPRGGARDVAGTPYDFRRARRIGDTVIDYAFTGLHRQADGRAWVRLREGVSGSEVGLWVDEHYDWIDIYTGEELPLDQRRRGLGVEPMTCPPNGFATGEGVVVMEAGDVLSTSWGIQVMSLRQGSAT